MTLVVPSQSRFDICNTHSRIVTTTPGRTHVQEDMDLAEDYLKFCVHYALTECAGDLELLQVPTLVQRSLHILSRVGVS